MTARVVNGRGVDSAEGGVGRYHREVSNRLQARGGFVLAQPSPIMRGPLRSRLWEQTTLASVAADSVLLSLLNGGPVRHPRHIVVLHDVLPLSHPATVAPTFARLQRLLLPQLARRASRIATVSDDSARAIQQHLGVAAERIAVIPPGISGHFRPGSRAEAKLALGFDPDRPLVLGYVSAIPRKNGDAVVDLLATLPAGDHCVQVASHGQDGPRRVFGPQQRPHHPLVRELGNLSDERQALAYRAADVFVSLSHAEGFGLPILEAAASGAAVVTTRVPSAGLVGEHALVVVDEARKAAAMIDDLLDAPHRRQEMAERAGEVLAPLTWDRTAHGLLHLTQELESRS